MEVGQGHCLKVGSFLWHIGRSVDYVFLRDCMLKSPDFRVSGSKYYMTLRRDRTKTKLILALIRYYYSPPQRLIVTMAPPFGENMFYRSDSMLENEIYFILDDWRDSSNNALSSELYSNNEFYYNNMYIICKCEKIKEKENTLMFREKLLGEDIREENKSSEANSIKEQTENKSEEIKEVEDSDEEEEDSEYKREEIKEVEDSDEEEEDSEYKLLKKLQEDFENLFKRGEDCDVTMKVQDKEFPAHRIILRARSPVFMSMFSHEMLEKHSGVVVIDDCDPGTFPDFLNYLYSGNTKHISEENVCHLFTASDKYQVGELKEKCSKFMKKHLSVETFCDFISLALMHREQELIDSATEFFCFNVVEIAKTAKWQTFLKENPTVGNELFLKSLSR